MEYTVRIHDNGKITGVKAEAGTNLLRFLQKNSANITSPCGGNGTCGKCRVLIKGDTILPSHKEKALLGDNAVDRGYRLACYNQIDADMDVYVEGSDGQAKIITDAKQRSLELEPLITKRYVEMQVPQLDNQTADLDRIMACTGETMQIRDIGFLREIPEIVRKNDFKVTLVSYQRMLMSVEPGDTTGKIYGMAVDIGTTTIAAYLYDLANGTKVDVYSFLNPQRKFGADVLSRIEYTMHSQASLDEMNAVIVDGINQAIMYFAENNKIDSSDIYAAVFVGNTTMMHFLMKVSAKYIASSPFTAATTQLHRFPAVDMGININKCGYTVLFPSVSGYIGADTVAAVLSSGMYMKDSISLLIDIGTNGEIVLGGSDWLYSCSTAAGPAFEGANIRNGVGGVRGAIDKVAFAPGYKYTTIGNEKAIGICGSGIVDAIAGMLSKGVIDETGRIADGDELENLDCDLKERLVNIGSMKAFIVSREAECDAGSDIAITQKDVRELQNAKAAIAAGIKTLIKRAGISMPDISNVYLAGGFGSYINIDSALAIGLIPVELKGHIESIGNAAGAGAVEGLLSVRMLKQAEIIKNRIKYIELSASADFTEEYVECMFF